MDGWVAFGSRMAEDAWFFSSGPRSSKTFNPYTEVVPYYKGYGNEGSEGWILALDSVCSMA